MKMPKEMLDEELLCHYKEEWIKLAGNPAPFGSELLRRLVERQNKADQQVLDKNPIYVCHPNGVIEEIKKEKTFRLDKITCLVEMAKPIKTIDQFLAGVEVTRQQCFELIKRTLPSGTRVQLEKAYDSLTVVIRNKHWTEADFVPDQSKDQNKD